MYKSADLNFYSSPCPPHYLLQSHLVDSDPRLWHFCAPQSHAALNCVLELCNFISFTELQGSFQAKELQICHFATSDFWYVITFLLRKKKSENNQRTLTINVLSSEL